MDAGSRRRVVRNPRMSNASTEDSFYDSMELDKISQECIEKIARYSVMAEEFGSEFCQKMGEVLKYYREFKKIKPKVVESIAQSRRRRSNAKGPVPSRSVEGSVNDEDVSAPSNKRLRLDHQAGLRRRSSTSVTSPQVHSDNEDDRAASAWESPASIAPSGSPEYGSHDGTIDRSNRSPSHSCDRPDRLPRNEDGADQSQDSSHQASTAEMSESAYSPHSPDYGSASHLLQQPSPRASTLFVRRISLSPTSAPRGSPNYGADESTAGRTPMSPSRSCDHSSSPMNGEGADQPHIESNPSSSAHMSANIGSPYDGWSYSIERPSSGRSPAEYYDGPASPYYNPRSPALSGAYSGVFRSPGGQSPAHELNQSEYDPTSPIHPRSPRPSVSTPMISDDPFAHPVSSPASQPRGCSFCAGLHDPLYCTTYREHWAREQQREHLELCRHCLRKFLPSVCTAPGHAKLCRNCGSHYANAVFCWHPLRRGPTSDHH